MRLRWWCSRLRVIDGGIEGRDFGEREPHTRAATFWEKVRYSLGLKYKGPKWREVEKLGGRSDGRRE